ncbi:adenylate/guanylate cyclase domain-containing protein [Skermania sp. ID1734]|uniref:adenylate/guanylate cyclase domain-containing protein n=1 Tax=Skermania sp. ID1734 TaxID=2597516 RepID=UPI00117F9502|nr:adenylate/guanylate cyclase domain-containing protein [Skermania sp. ID1734]TSE01477.1 adenylate/guanylate cyclase domain-containing protein [Skermania sp. ID1734]
MRVDEALGRAQSWFLSRTRRTARFQEFSEAGLLRGLNFSARQERFAMLSRLADAGVSTPRLVKASAEGRLAHLVMREALTPRGPKYTLEEIASLAGLPLDDVERWFRAMGRGVASRTEPDYGDADLRLAQVLIEYRQIGLDETGLFAAARILGRNLWAMADAVESLTNLRLSAAGDDSEVAVRLASEVTRLAQFQADILAHLVATRLASSTLTDEGVPSRDLAVGFADLVGFTSLGEVAEPTELAELAEQLDRLTTESIEPPVRFVKTVGDAVMLISSDPNALARTISRIFGAARADGLPPLHAGIAWGPALPRAGDWIGRTVNLASRIAATAKRDTIYLDEAMYAHLDPKSFSCEPAGQFALKGYDGARPLYRLREG